MAATGAAGNMPPVNSAGTGNVWYGCGGGGDDDSSGGGGTGDDSSNDDGGGAASNGNDDGGGAASKGGGTVAVAIACASRSLQCSTWAGWPRTVNTRPPAGSAGSSCRWQPWHKTRAGHERSGVRRE